jgi:type I restriction enzyme S subunit
MPRKSSAKTSRRFAAPLVADTGGLLALARVAMLPALGRMYGPILIPPSVRDECLAKPRAADAQAVACAIRTRLVRVRRLRLHAGESDAIRLAMPKAPALMEAVLAAVARWLPPFAEQRAIAHILGALDDKIELNRRMSETLEGMARALFKSWFVDFDPVRAKAEGRDPGIPNPLADLFPDRLVDSELGEIPEGWEVKGLDQIARFLNGLALQKHPPTGDRSLPVIKIAQLRSRRADGADRASADLDPDYIVADGDILFSWSGSLECVLWTGGPGALNQHLFKVTSSTYPRWLCYFAVHHHLDDFRHIAAGKATTMGHIQRHHLADAKVAVPAISIPREIDQCLSPLFESVWVREVESRTLAALRDALLPKLISGELRVTKAQRVTGALA